MPFRGLTKAIRIAYSFIKLRAIVVQWSEHRLVTSEVAGSSPVSRELVALCNGLLHCCVDG